MNIILWFAISIAIAAGCIILYRTILASTFIATFSKYLFLKYLIYPQLVKRKYWTGVTRFQAGLIGGYVIINGFCMGLGIKSTSDLMLRSGTMASINLIPLFLGGRTNILANLMGISLHTYYIAHHWVGRIVIIQSLVHVGLVVYSGTPWTFDSSQISGITSASAMALILLTSVYIVRRLMYEVFLKVHFFFALLAVVALLQHLLPAGLRRFIYPVISLSLWGLHLLLRITMSAVRNLGGRRYDNKNQCSVIPFLGSAQDDTVTALRVSVQLHRPLRIKPGQYLYLSFSDMGIRGKCQSHPYVITWWDNSMRAMELSFLIQPHSGMSSQLISRNSIRSVVIDGPYGKDLHLDDYETVILVAKGIGIAGILPYARHMTYRRVSKGKSNEVYRRGLITRKLDIIWALDDNSQDAWVSEWLQELQMRDKDKLILTVTCFYPDQKSKPPVVPGNTHWRFLYGRNSQQTTAKIEEMIRNQTQRSPGKTKVAVCGNSSFSESIRNSTLKNMHSNKTVAFAETEFQPQEVRQAYPGIHTFVKGDIEMAVIPADTITERKMTPNNTLSDVVGSPSLALRGKSKSSQGDRDGLIRSYSGISSKLKSLPEIDTDIEYLMIDKQGNRRKVEASEIV